MRILLFFLCTALLPLLVKSQAHLGSTLDDIKKLHPDKEFIIDTTQDGNTIVKAQMDLGMFYYYFGIWGRSEYCAQIPTDNTAMNRQIEIFNELYVKIDSKTWKYYSNGCVMVINLVYIEEKKAYMFTYKYE
jgi:hypothetical protein